MSEKDDEDWWKALAGEEVKDADVNTLREAQALRAAMLEYAQKDAAPDFDAEAGAQRLLFRLRRESLLAAEKRSWQVPISLALAATLALAIGVGIYIEKEGTEEGPWKTRGIEAVKTLEAENPRELRDQLVKELTALGARPNAREEKGIHVIEGAWPAKPTPEHEAFLERHKLQAPDGYVLEIRVRERKR